MHFRNICRLVRSAKRLAALALGAVCASLCLLLPAWALESANADLDTLFYTPAQRSDIVGARQPQPGGSLLGKVQKFTGIVRRTNGKSTVWINGKAQQEGQPKTPLMHGVDAVVDGQRLRVGESVDSLTGLILKLRSECAAWQTRVIELRIGLCVKPSPSMLSARKNARRTDKMASMRGTLTKPAGCT